MAPPYPLFWGGMVPPHPFLLTLSHIFGVVTVGMAILVGA